MEWGFKAYAKRIADATRKELGLSPFASLDGFALAEDLGVSVLEFSDLFEALSRKSWRQLAELDEGAFSAMTVFLPERTVVLNDLHHEHRQRTSLAHEMAHALLMHPALPVHALRVGEHRDSEHEQQASFLGGVLLLPDEACLALARAETSLADASRQYGVSKDFVQYRLRVSGALVRRKREVARRGSRS